eukprot:NODE_162_length_14959_cov_1.379610.p5 type:complete len:375 gc:universal NODE_162_length_14959_cov_1.379610:5452-6576(+)
MWESIPLSVTKCHYFDGLFLEQKDSLLHYDMQGRKILDQYSKPVSFVFDGYFVANNILYKSHKFSETIKILETKIDDICRSTDYWIILYKKTLYLYSLDGKLLDEKKFNSHSKLIQCDPPLLSNKIKNLEIRISMNKLNFSENKIVGICHAGEGSVVLQRADDKMLLYYNYCEALCLPWPKSYFIYDKFIFLHVGNEIRLYDCEFGVQIKSLNIDFEISEFIYSGKFLIAFNDSEIVFTSFLFTSGIDEILKLNVEGITLDLGLEKPEDLNAVNDILTCDKHDVPLQLALMTVKEISLLFVNMKSDLTDRLLYIIQILNKQDHPFIQDTRKQLFKYLENERKKSLASLRLKSKIQALEKMPKCVLPYSVENVYF